ncbi:MAG: hypothetical protein WCS87_01395 [Methylococcaceae bacterium]
MKLKIAKEMKIADRIIGPNHPPFITAEMSGNQNQSLERAFEILEAAAKTGAHALKIQTYTPDTMTLDLDEREIHHRKKHPKKLEIQYQWMEAHPNIVLSGHQSIKISENVAVPELPESLVVRRVNKYSLLFSNRFPTRSVMVKREVSYRFLPEKRYEEDYLLWLKIVFNGQPAWFLNSPMAYSFKEDFGDEGLTGNLWETQLGVLDTYYRVFSAGFISIFMLTLASGFSFFKCLRRLGITKGRSLFNGRVTKLIVS